VSRLHCDRYNRSQQAAGDVTSSMDVTHWQNTGTAISRIIARLRDMTDKLRNAYRGLDVQWSSAGQYGESVLVICSVNLLLNTHARARHVVWYRCLTSSAVC